MTRLEYLKYITVTRLRREIFHFWFAYLGGQEKFLQMPVAEQQRRLRSLYPLLPDDNLWDVVAGFTR